MSDRHSGRMNGHAIVHRILIDPTLGVLALLVIFAVGAAILLPVFYAGNNLLNLVGSSITVMILAIGVTVVLISGGIDLSVGAVMALSAGAAATSMRLGLPVFAAFGAAILVGILAGVVNGLLVTRVGLPDFIATLATLGFASGVLYIWTQGVPIIGYMTPEFRLVGGLQPVFGQVTLPMIIALALALIVGWVLSSTSLGTRYFAVGSNPVAARQSGIRVRWVKTQAYMLSGTCAAIAGISNATILQMLQAAVDAITLALAINIINLVGVPSSFQKIVIGAILLLAVFANFVSDRVRSAALRRRATHFSSNVA